MKKTYNYETKARARNDLRKFVEQIYPKLARRKDLRVLTLLGHEPYELEQIWDPLGVPRENIVCVEKIPEAYKMIQSQNWGVRMLDQPQNLETFVSETKEIFDVINIDETSQFGLPQRDALRAIAGRHLIGEKGILATWYLGRREGGYTKSWFEDAFQAYQNETSETAGKIRDRSNLLSRMICSIFADGITNRGSHEMLRFPCNAQLFRNYVEQTIDSFVDRNGKKISSEEAIKSSAAIHQFVTENIESLLIEKGNKSGKKISENDLGFLTDLLFYEGAESYFSMIQKRLKYIGDTGAPMLVDMNFFKQVDLSVCANLDYNSEGGVKINHTHQHCLKEANQLAREFYIWKARCSGRTLVPRDDLGSSYGENNGQVQEQPFIKEKPINLQPLPEPIKEEIRQLRREGFEVEDMYHYLIGKGISTTIPQVSAIASWVHPKLAKKKQEASP